MKKWHILLAFGILVSSLFLYLSAEIKPDTEHQTDPGPSPEAQSTETTGARWTGSITIDEPEHIVLGSMKVESRTEFTLTLVEKISTGGSVSLELESLDWRKEKRTESIIDRGYISFRYTEFGRGGCSGSNGECSASGYISYGEDKISSTGITGHYSLSVRARGQFLKYGKETSARHVSTGEMSHKLEPYTERISENYEGSVGVIISGDLSNGLTVMNGNYGGTSWYLSKAALPIEIELEPVNIESYETFIPAMGRSLGVKIKIVDSSGMIGYPYFELDDVSSMPGYCMNAEIDSEDLDWIRSIPGLDSYDQEGPDWVLRASENDFFIEGQQQGAKGKNAVSKDTIAVTALDAGAVGKIRAYMIINGIPYQAKVKYTGETFLSLPLDADPVNMIADAADQNEAPSPEEDEDDTPEGNGNTGDGLTAYEEYRGFIVAGGAYVRTDIGRKTIFVRNRYGHYWLAYRLLDLEAYDIEEEQLPPGGRLLKPGYINYYHENYDKWDIHERDQYVVIIKESLAPGFIGANGFCRGLHPPSKMHHDVKILPESHLRSQSAGHSEITFEEYLRRLIDHELGHRVGIDHHGKKDERRYKDIAGNIWYWVAVTGGEHSGWDGCLMRYHNAVGYLQDPDLREVIEFDPPVRGGDFCVTLEVDEMCGLSSVGIPCVEQFWVKSPINVVYVRR